MTAEIINSRTCAFCLKLAEGWFTVHRDGFGVGPEVDLCNVCAAEDGPTLEEIWAKIGTKNTGE